MKPRLKQKKNYHFFDLIGQSIVGTLGCTSIASKEPTQAAERPAHQNWYGLDQPKDRLVQNKYF